MAGQRKVKCKPLYVSSVPLSMFAELEAYARTMGPRACKGDAVCALLRQALDAAKKGEMSHVGKV